MQNQDKIITIETGNLLDFMRPGILALIDYSNGRAYLSCAVNIADNYFRQLKLIHLGQHTVQREELHLFKGCVVEFIDNTNNLTLAYANACEKLTQSNFKIISRNIKYKIKGRILPNFRSNGSKYLYYVHLYSQKYPVKLIGVFNGCTEADVFMDKHYPGGRLQDNKVVVSDNELTNLYLLSLKQITYNQLMGV